MNVLTWVPLGSDHWQCINIWYVTTSSCNITSLVSSPLLPLDAQLQRSRLGSSAHHYDRRRWRVGNLRYRALSIKYSTQEVSTTCLLRSQPSTAETSGFLKAVRSQRGLAFSQFRRQTDEIWCNPPLRPTLSGDGGKVRSATIAAPNPSRLLPGLCNPTVGPKLSVEVGHITWWVAIAKNTIGRC